MGSPVGGANQGNGSQELEARIREWVRDELSKAARGGIGLHLDGSTGNLIIDKGDVRSGNYAPGSAGWDLAPSGSAELGATTVRGGKLQSGNYVAGTSGWGLDGAGNAEFNAVTLRAGIIDNAALASPVTGASGTASGTATVTTTIADYAVVTITIPAGFSRAEVVGISSVSGSGSSSVLGVWTRIAGNDGPLNYAAVSGAYAAASSAHARSLTGLSGGSLSVSTRAQAASGSITTNLTTAVMVTFLR